MFFFLFFFLNHKYFYGEYSNEPRDTICVHAGQALLLLKEWRIRLKRYQWLFYIGERPHVMTDHLFRVTICQCPSVTQNVAMSIQFCLNDRERKSDYTDGQLAFSKALLTYLSNDWLVFIISTEYISSSIKNYLYSFELSNSHLTSPNIDKYPS